MVGEEYGWVPLDGWAITLLIIWMLIVVMIPGFLLSLAIFPKRTALRMSERMVLSFGLGLTAPFVLMMLNRLFEVKVTFISSLIMFIFLSVLGVLGFLNRGGNLNLVEWYKEKE